jgi:hypothetical protein
MPLEIFYDFIPIFAAGFASCIMQFSTTST